MSITPQAMSGAALLSTLPSSSTVYLDGDVHYMVMNKSSWMRILLRTADELFTTFVDREAPAAWLNVVVNGMFYDVTAYGLGWAVLGTTSGEGSRTIPLGQIVDSQRVVGGQSRPNHYYVAQALGPMSTYTFGDGDPPSSGQSAAIGGAGPMIINGLKYGDGNLYLPGGPPGPATGAPPASAAPYLIQRNNATFLSFESGGPRRGKTVIAYSSSQEKLLVVHQKEAAPSGISLADLRDRLVAIGVDNAVFFDGGNSAMLWVDSSWITRPGSNKDRTNAIGIGFRVVP